MNEVDNLRASYTSRHSIGAKGFAVLLLFAALTEFAVPAQAAFVRVGELAKDFTLTDRMTKQSASLSDFAGKVIFIDLFAYW